MTDHVGRMRTNKQDFDRAEAASSLHRRHAAVEAVAVEAELGRDVDELFAHLERHLGPESFARLLRFLEPEGRGAQS